MSAKSKDRYAMELLEYFYPIHYQINMVLEDAMRGSLSRREAALLWLLYAEGGVDVSLPRKLVVDKLHSWFDSTSSNVTKIIARLEDSRLQLVKITNEPGSARDKRVKLTRKGRAFVHGMLKKGAAHSLLMNMSEKQIRAGVRFFREAAAATSNAVPVKKLEW